MSVSVPPDRAEEARAQMLDLFPEGFEEVDAPDGIELVAYTDGAGQERFAAVFGAVSGRDVPDDWHDRWRAFHRGVRVGPLWVGPPWETPEPGAVAVAIDPGRAFGTGAHATTRLCLEFLAELPPADVAVANIALDAVQALGGRLRARSAITSGYLASEQPVLAGFHIVERRERDGWAADLHAAR